MVYVALSVDQKHDSRDRTNPVDFLHIYRLPWIELGMWAQYFFYRDVLKFGRSRTLLELLAMVTC